MWEEIKKSIETNSCRLRNYRDIRKISVQETTQSFLKKSTSLIEEFNIAYSDQEKEQLPSAIANIGVDILNIISTVHVHEVPIISKFTLERIGYNANLSVDNNPAKLIADYINVINRVINDTGNRKVAVVKTLILLYHISKKTGYDLFRLIDEKMKELESIAGEYDEKKKEWIEDKSEEVLLNRYLPNYLDCKLNG